MPETTSATLSLSGDDEADKLLSADPLALLIGMVLDQQVPLEWAFKGPLMLRERLGGRLDAGEIAAMDPEELATAFAHESLLSVGPALTAMSWNSVVSVHASWIVL